MKLSDFAFHCLFLISLVLCEESSKSLEDERRACQQNGADRDSQSCDDDIAKWANSLPALKKQDASRSAQLDRIDPDNLMNLRLIDVRNLFYGLLSQPLQTVCKVAKKIGGEWLGNCGWFDGEKYVCMDHLKKAVEKKECLVYSFGLADDWSFEEVMAGLGCTVRAFDPTVEKPASVTDPRIHFEKLGLAHFNGKTEVIIRPQF